MTKKLSFTLAMATLLVALCAVPTMAGPISNVSFNAASLVQTAVTNTGVPAAGDGAMGSTAGWIRTYVGDTETTAFNAQLATWGAGEGISEFNLWLQGGVTSQSADWGENLSISNWDVSTIIPSAPAGWNAALVPAPASWGTDFAGRQLISYYTTDASLYIRPGSTQTFSFTAELNESVSPLTSYVLWVGAGGQGDSSLSGTSGLVGTDITSFQRAVTATAEPVPEPATLTLLGLGLVGVAGAARKRKK